MTRFKILVLKYLIANIVTICSASHLDAFLSLRKTNFSSWIYQRGYDPSPLIAGPIPLVISNNVGNLDFTFSDYGVRGYTDAIEFGDEVSYLVTKPPMSPYFYLGFHTTGNITYFGQYAANGTLFSTIPVLSSGDWSISVTYLEISGKFDFSIRPDGTLYMSESRITYIGFGADWIDINFQNLYDNDSVANLKGLMEEMLFTEFRQFLSTSMGESNDPVSRFYQQYWDEIFSESTLADILATDLPLQEE